MLRRCLGILLILFFVAGGQREALGVTMTLANWIKELATQGDAEAQFSLGAIYYEGKSVPQDYVEAMKWFLLAANQKHANAQFHLGQMYEEGQGVPRNNVQAHKWYNLATVRATGELQSRAISRRSLREVFMTSADVIEAQRLAREWQPTTPGK